MRDGHAVGVSRGGSGEDGDPVASRGLLAFAAGEYEQAIGLLEDVCARTEPIDDVQVFVSLARSLAATGRYEDAVRVLQATRARLPEGGAPHARTTIILTAALCDAGRPGDARDTLAEIALRADGDLRMRGRFLWASARISTFEHDPERSLATVDEAIAVYEMLDAPVDIGRMHLMAAETLNCQTGRHLLALGRVDQAAARLAGTSQQDEVAVSVQRAHSLAHLSEPETALQLARAALAQLNRSAQDWEHGMARWAAAAALERLGAPDAHDEYLHAYRQIRIDTRYIPRLADAIIRTKPQTTIDPRSGAYLDGARMLDLVRAERELADALRVIRDHIDILARAPRPDR